MTSELKVKCPQCGAPSVLCFSTGDLNRKLTNATFFYHECGSCSLIFLHPVPKSLAPYYPEGYYDLPATHEALAANAKHEAYKIELVRRHVRKGRVIEVGPATGGFCYLAKEAGYDVEAIEMDQRCSNFLRSALGIKVLNSATETEALRSLQPANVIALWHVLEHLLDPWKMLEAIQDRLSPGGIAVIATPNPQAIQFQIWGKRWVHVDAPRHLFLIPSAVLVHRMRRLGLELVELTTRDPGGVGWNRFGWVFGASNLSPISALDRPFRAIGRLIGLAAAPFEGIEGKGAAYTAIFRKSIG
ncbi:class I SAM-dependent methyltransferase [Methylocaldum sp.]|uniref:class I SAM-dependent methyltransferase n=1 Tax=Methylocaldum sp. TaxID=1969727 RepID=UPI00321FA76E